MTRSRAAWFWLLTAACAGLTAVLVSRPRPVRSDSLPPWEDPQVVGVNKLAPHAPLYPFADAASAASLDRSRSPFYRLLNGRWRFKFSANPDARPTGFEAPAFDDSGWDTIPVPANIEKQGYAPPVYVNIGYAWGEGRPPLIPRELNYVGSATGPSGRRRTSTARNVTCRPSGTIPRSSSGRSATRRVTE